MILIPQTISSVQKTEKTKIDPPSPGLIVRSLPESRLKKQTIQNEDGRHCLRRKEDGHMDSHILQTTAVPEATYREKKGQHRSYMVNLTEVFEEPLIRHYLKQKLSTLRAINRCAHVRIRVSHFGQPSFSGSHHQIDDSKPTGIFSKRK